MPAASKPEAALHVPVQGSGAGGDLCHLVTPAGPRGEVGRLVLPMPGRFPADCSPTRTVPRRCRQPLAEDLVLLRAATGGIVPDRLVPPAGPDELIRYRWMVGHQAAFGVWQLLAERLNEIRCSPAPTRRSVQGAARLYDAYSVLFLYTGSCTAERYAATVRRDMTACDPAFSGEWARDHEPVPLLVRGVRRTHPEELLAPMSEAIRVNHWIHLAVAQHLVPGGASLLQSAGRRPGSGPSEAERTRYDGFFLVERRQVCRRSKTAQLLRRLTQVACDLAAHGLPALPCPARLAESRVRAVRQVERSAHLILRDAADQLCYPDREGHQL